MGEGLRPIIILTFVILRLQVVSVNKEETPVEEQKTDVRSVSSTIGYRTIEVLCAVVADEFTKSDEIVTSIEILIPPVVMERYVEQTLMRQNILLFTER